MEAVSDSKIVTNELHPDFTLFLPFSDGEIVKSAQVDEIPEIYNPSRSLDLEKFKSIIAQMVWMPTKIIFTQDLVHFQALTPAEQRQIKELLVFFAISEHVVVENLGNNFLAEIDCPHVKDFIMRQIVAENIHAEIYRTQLEKLCCFNDIKSLVESAKVSEFTLAKIEWMKRRFNRELPLPLRMAAAVCAEGILFQVGFAYIFNLGLRDIKMHGIGQANEYISKDENLHCLFSIFMFKQLSRVYKETLADIWEIFEDAANVEKQFARYLLSLNGDYNISIEDMERYIDHVANKLYTDCGFPAKKTTTNPLAYMATYTSPIKYNNFERESTAYVRDVKVSFDYIDKKP